MLWNRLLWLGLGCLGSRMPAGASAGARPASQRLQHRRAAVPAAGGAGTPEVAISRDPLPEPDSVVAEQRPPEGRLTVPLAARRGVGGLAMLHLRLGFELDQLSAAGSRGRCSCLRCSCAVQLYTPCE